MFQSSRRALHEIGALYAIPCKRRAERLRARVEVGRVGSTMKHKEAQEAILGLLIVAPSPFAALFGFVARTDIAAKPSVNDVFGFVTDVERRGWVRVTQAMPD